MKRYLGIGPLLAATSLAAPAAAQTETPESQATLSEQSRDDALAKIIVTASRREETLQHSSLSIEVLDREDVADAGTTRVADLQDAVPSLTSASSGQNLSTYIRGVGSLAIDANGDSSIAYNINNVVIARTSGVGPIFFDLERVEVLKGPQGTLYGRNASGGAINLITRRPSQRASAEISLDVGSYDLIRLFGAAGGPISDTLSVRAAGQLTKHNGYLTDGYNDQDDIAARLSALWTPDSDISLLLVGEFVRAEGQGSGGAFRSSRQPLPSDPWTGPTQAPPPQAAIVGPDDILTDGFVDTKVYAISAELTWDMGPVTLTLIPAYRNTKPVTLTYQPGFYFSTAETASQQSYELRLGNDGSALQWVMGAYFFRERQTQDYTALARPIQQSHVTTSLATDSYAVFGDATYAVTPAWRLLGGLRYSSDDKSQDGTSVSTLPFAVTVDNYGRRKDDNLSFRVGSEFDLTEDNMLFATVATGYKAGGFFPSVPYPNNTYEPEKVTAYTLGLRNRFFDDQIQVNFEAFYWNYHNKQERFLGALASGGVNLLTTNAGKATLYGANLSLAARIGGGTLRASMEYLHSRYDSFSYVVANAGPLAPLGYSTLATSCVLGPLTVLAPTVTTQPVNCAGKPLPHAPKWSGSVDYVREFALTGDFQVTPRVAMRFADRMFLSPDFIPSGSDDGYITFDASVRIAHAGFALTGWVRNITNKAIYSGGFRYPFSAHEPFGDPTVFYADIRPPRRFGVTLSASY